MKKKFNVEAWLLKESYQLVKAINNCKDQSDFNNRSIGFMERAKIIEKLASDCEENASPHLNLHYKFQNMKLHKKVRK